MSSPLSAADTKSTQRSPIAVHRTLSDALAVAIASNLGIHVGGRPLFADVSFKLEPRDRMTLAGRNGAGKSTLLRILSGELRADSGSLSVGKGRRVALHDQRPPRSSDASLGDYVFTARADMQALEDELGRLEAAMSGGASDEATLVAYSAAQARLETGGGYRWRDDVLNVLRGLGFDPEQAARPLSTFSGGELTRASLARALAARPDLLLLDEPTNHLDIPALEWLEGHLTSLDSAVVLVAHDRWSWSSRRGGRASSRVRGTRGAPSRRRARSPWASRSSASGPRSRGWSGSWSGFATRPRRRGRPSPG
jgi:ATP-binding cassette, subfamily F, member 3